MDPLWSPVVPTDRNRRQIRGTQKPRKQPKSVAVGCHRLPLAAHGNGGGRRFESARGLCKSAANCRFLLPLDLHCAQLRRVWSPLWSLQVRKRGLIGAHNARFGRESRIAAPRASTDAGPDGGPRRAGASSLVQRADGELKATVELWSVRRRKRRRQMGSRAFAVSGPPARRWGVGIGDHARSSPRPCRRGASFASRPIRIASRPNSNSSSRSPALTWGGAPVASSSANPPP